MRLGHGGATHRHWLPIRCTSCQSRAVRIVVTGANQTIVGGAETYTSWLLRTLVARGHEVAFGFEHASPGSDQTVDRGVDRLARWHIGSMSRPEFFERVASFRPDIVFLQSAADSTLDLELARSFRAVLFVHSFYGTCATGRKVHHRPTLQTCKRSFGPGCLPVNYLRGCGARSPVQLLNLYADQRVRAKAVQGLAGLVVASEYMRQVCVQNGVDDRIVRLLPYPNNLEPDPAPPALRELPRRVLFLGRLTADKGGARAIQAIARCQGSIRDRRLVLTLAGDGPELERCRRLATKLGVSCEFPGWVDAERRLLLLRSADVLIVPSQWPEPFGMVGLEAASVGVPAVAYETGGIVDWLRPGVNGELAEGFGPRTLAAALERALSSPEHYERLQRGAWHAAREFAGNQHAARLEAFFQGLSHAS